MQVATLAIAILALLVSCLSFAWQIFSFSASGRKVRAYVSIGWRGAEDDSLILSSIKRRDDPLDRLSQLSGKGPSTPVLGVTVHNVGRSDLYVSAVFVAGTSKADTHIPAVRTTWPQLPHLLKSGDSENWYLDAAEFERICAGWNLINGNRRSTIELRISLKDGRTVRARRRIKVAELQRIWNVAKASSGLPVGTPAPGTA
ncbi:hypothetical protein [Lentzea sp. NPDC004782]|uniref:hypothetical protein n=1 Tax=Lentzea sp. NPDC004782 TaxID=3154458 RepID=UPI0033AE07A8